MNEQEYLKEQERRIRLRIDRSNEVITGDHDGLARFKASKVLAAQELALQRIAIGKYGICIDCEARISRARLDRVPAAIRCVGCQTAYERRQR